MIPTELPPGWEKVSLGDVLLRIEAGKSFTCEPRQADPNEWGIIKVSAMTWGRFNENENKAVPEGREVNPAYEIREGDILVSRANTQAYVGAPVLVGKTRRGLLLSDKSLRLVPSESIDKRWLIHFLSSPVARNFISKKATGTKDSMRNISQQTLLAMPMMLPPLAEQQRIVEAVDGLMSRLDSAASNISLAQLKADRLSGLLLGKAVSGGFSDPVQVSDKVDASAIEKKSRSLAANRWKPVPPIDIEGYDPPSNWTMMSLGSLAFSSGYGTSTKCDYGATGQPVLRIPNVQGGTIDLADIKFAIEPELDLSRFFLEPGDLLFVRTNGSPRLIGRVGVVEKSLPYAFASYLIRFRLTPGVVEPRWVEMVTKSPLWRRAIEKYSASSAGQYNLSSDTLSQLPIPVPPLEVQRRTLESVDSALTGVRRLASVTSGAANRADHIRRAVLNRALAGSLAPQDNDDEPASALFAQIRAERKAQGEAKGVRTRPPRVSAAAPIDPPLPLAAASNTPTSRAVQQELEL